ncbi:MAG TPA: hypothetical protein VGX03_13770, partial [Candidatus Binatia bacterium]|nr:hypothetical protein [Candidatus Binatia bacterium]
LLMLGTYRPVEVLTREHPLKAVKQELQVHGHCRELPVDFLAEAHVAEYLKRRFPSCDRQGAEGRSLADARGSEEAAAWRRLAQLIHQRTDGNPLFMVNLVDHLLSQGVLVQVDGQWTLKEEKEATAAVPETLQQMIEQRLAQMSPAERTVLEVASVAGTEFSAAIVAAGVETTVEAVEAQCAELARRETFLRACGTADWPDGTVATRYGFLHALYQEVLYERLTAGRRQRLHQWIGEREEAGYGEHAREIAAELALHFEQGREYRKAVQYLQYAGKNASRRSANQEAIGLLTKALELLKTLPDTPERTQQELRLQLTLAVPLIATKGFTAPEVERAYTRALELCRQLGETLQLFWVLLGLWTVYFVRAELKTARELAEQCLSLAQNTHNPRFLVWAHNMLGNTLYCLGEFALAREHLEAGIALYDPQQHRSSGALEDPKVNCLSYAALALWLLGYPDQAQQRSHEALTLAQELSRPYILAFALGFAAQIHQFRREVQAVQERTETVMALSTEQGFPLFLAAGPIRRGWALAAQGQVEEGISQIRQGMDAWWATGGELSRPYYLAWLAEAYGKAEEVEEGLTVLAEALAAVDRTGERVFEAELYRLKGQLTLQKFQVSGSKVQVPPNPQAEAEACFLKAIEIARKQQAKSLELRATVSLAKLWQSQGKKEEARQMLAEIYGWFTEGFDTADLKEAKVLLEELA